MSCLLPLQNDLPGALSLGGCLRVGEEKVDYVLVINSVAFVGVHLGVRRKTTTQSCRPVTSGEYTASAGLAHTVIR